MALIADSDAQEVFIAAVAPKSMPGEVDHKPNSAPRTVSKYFPLVGIFRAHEFSSIASII
jgi:hypothetical protein